LKKHVTIVTLKMDKRILAFILICIGVFLSLTYLFFSLLSIAQSKEDEETLKELNLKLNTLKENYLQLERYSEYLNETCVENFDKNYECEDPCRLYYEENEDLCDYYILCPILCWQNINYIENNLKEIKNKKSLIPIGAVFSGY